VSKDDDEVGYGKPPRKYRFKKGQSGNPKGRPKGARSIPTLLAKELQAKVIVREGSRTKQITKLELIIRKRVNDAIQGNARDAAALIDLVLKFMTPEAVETATETLSDAEQKIFEQYLTSLKQRDSKGS